MTDKNDMAYWYPLVKSLVPTPKTKIIHTDVNLIQLLDGRMPEGYDLFIKSLTHAIKKLGGCPVFLRTGHTSGKHEWEKTCYLKSEKDIPPHVASLVNYSDLVNYYSECAGIIGLPYQTWAVRELLPTKPVFHAFKGMPITQEFRFFVEDGNVVHKQPYWPPESFEICFYNIPDIDNLPPNWMDGKNDYSIKLTEELIAGLPPKNWRELLSDISQLDTADDLTLGSFSKMIGEKVGGYWSIDWLNTEKGWYMIDMALGAESYKWDGGLTTKKEM